MHRYWQILLLLFLSSCSSNPKENVITIGLSPDYPPFEFIIRGKLQGFDIDLGEALGKELGKTIEFIDMPFPSLIPALESNRVDLVLAGLTITKERLERVDFSLPYYMNQFAYLIRLGQTIEDIKLKKIGVQLGSAMEHWLKESEKAEHLISLENNNLLVEMLKTKKIDAVLLDLPQAIAFKNGSPELVAIPIGETREESAIALKKGSPLKEKLNQALQKIISNGTLEKLKQKWIKTDVS